jgi:Bacterial type II/III secretion system short domain
MKIEKINCLIFITLFALSLPGFAIAQTAVEKSVEKVLQEPPKFKVKLFEIRHRNPESLRSAVRALGSGAGGSDIEANQQLRTLTVRDFPENIAAIEEALKRLDVPEQSPVSLEFQIHLISASMTSSEPKVQVSKNLEPVITQLKASLKFTNYRYISSALSRANDGGSINSSGITGSLFPVPSGITNNLINPSFYQYRMRSIKLMQDSLGKETIQIGEFFFGVNVPISFGTNVQYRDIGITTPLTLKEGEMAVVGTANIGGSDEAIIVVVSVHKVR